MSTLPGKPIRAALDGLNVLDPTRPDPPACLPPAASGSQMPVDHGADVLKIEQLLMGSCSDALTRGNRT
jgi:hypothetical protein